AGGAGQMNKVQIEISGAEIADFCRRHRIRKLALFGSVLREDFGPDSDVDVLVEFEPDFPVGLIRCSAIQREPTGLFGREVDLNLRWDTLTEDFPPLIAAPETILQDGGQG
ncbi:MAG: nucleotidyltransferase domain-containing protein, partial [bacterium]